jgi:hypothetical protein
MNDELIYDNNIYPVEVILQAINDYRDICTIEVVQTDKTTRCIFSEGKTDMSVIMREFTNYLLELMEKWGE